MYVPSGIIPLHHEFGSRAIIDTLHAYGFTISYDELRRLLTSAAEEEIRSIKDGVYVPSRIIPLHHEFGSRAIIDTLHAYGFTISYDELRRLLTSAAQEEIRSIKDGVYVPSGIIPLHHEFGSRAIIDTLHAYGFTISYDELRRLLTSAAQEEIRSIKDGVYVPSRIIPLHHEFGSRAIIDTLHAYGFTISYDELRRLLTSAAEEEIRSIKDGVYVPSRIIPLHHEFGSRAIINTLHAYGFTISYDELRRLLTSAAQEEIRSIKDGVYVPYRIIPLHHEFGSRAIIDTLHAYRFTISYDELRRLLTSAAQEEIRSIKDGVYVPSRIIPLHHEFGSRAIIDTLHAYGFTISYDELRRLLTSAAEEEIRSIKDGVYVPSCIIPLHHEFGSRAIIDTLHAYGFTISYDELRRLLTSAAQEELRSIKDGVYVPSRIIPLHHVIQEGVDNIDVNIDTIDGKYTFHSIFWQGLSLPATKLGTY